MKVLIIEDDLDVVESLVIFFEFKLEEAAVITASRGWDGIELARKDSPDIIILDLGLPDIDGLEVLSHIRDFSNVPIIILSARNEEAEKIRGLELGADDYITKPYSPADLLARIKAVLRRVSISHEITTSGNHVARGKLKIDLIKREVSIEDKLVKLSPTEYRLLCELAINEGKVLSNQMLLEKIWGPEYTNETVYIKANTQRLREKLEEEPDNPKMVLSEPGIGYKFVGS